VTIDVDRSTVLLSLRPPYAAAILAGTKTVEFRRKALPDGVETALIWRTGKDGGIVGRFLVARQEVRTAESWTTLNGVRTVPGGGIPPEALFQYAGGPDGALWGISVTAVERLERRLDPKQLHPTLFRPPQSWRYAPARWRERWTAAVGW
jgi:predicted transcriptional regulator